MFRRAATAVLALLLALSQGACGMGGAGDVPSGGAPPTGGGPIGDTMSAEELALAREIFDLVNAERSSRSLPPYAWHDGMSDVAYDHGVDMDARNFFDHVNPDQMGPGQRLTMAGIGWTAVAENIAMGTGLSTDEVMAMWMGSSGHRANILSTVVNQIGVGVHVAGSTSWWVQVFRTP